VLKIIKDKLKLVFLRSFILLMTLTLLSFNDALQKNMVLVEAGTTSSDNGSVTVDNNFYIGKYHVTQKQFEEVMGFNPSYFNDEDHPNLTGNTDKRPVENVTWYDTVMYCNKLSESEGLDKYYNISDINYYGDVLESEGNPDNIKSATVTENEGANGYRLSTEDEHEYAARGGKDGNATTYAGSDNLDEVGWYWKNSGDKWLDGDWEGDRIINNNSSTHPVGEKEANELGLYDMSGNVWDWTNTSSGSYRIIRGGSWNVFAYRCEVGYIRSSNSSYRNSTISSGFRLTRSS